MKVKLRSKRHFSPLAICVQKELEVIKFKDSLLILLVQTLGTL